MKQWHADLCGGFEFLQSLPALHAIGEVRLKVLLLFCCQVA
jgi:hypothetical protein